MEPEQQTKKDPNQTRLQQLENGWKKYYKVDQTNLQEPNYMKNREVLRQKQQPLKSAQQPQIPNTFSRSFTVNFDTNLKLLREGVQQMQKKDYSKNLTNNTKSIGKL